MIATIRIIRSGGERSEFTVQIGEFTTLLDALEQIRSEQDGGLLYRHSCHHGSCGTCGVIANGKRVLSCLTRVNELEQPVEVRPLTPYPVIGDLAIDAAPLYSEFPDDASILRPSDAQPDAIPPAEISVFTRFENCIECGLCESVCPLDVYPAKHIAVLQRKIGARKAPV